MDSSNQPLTAAATTLKKPDGADDNGPLIDPATFVPPNPLPSPSVVIEFCDRCRWLHRATWVSTELFLTFPPPTLRAITLVPLNGEDTAGRFRVWVCPARTGQEQPEGEGDDDDGSQVEKKGPLTATMVWDRKSESAFPELKVLKQRVRDCVDRGRALGHSDRKI